MNKLKVVVALIGYNRPAHFEATIGAVTSQLSEVDVSVHCFLDGPRCEADKPDCEAVRSICAEAFDEEQIHLSANNIGLRSNVIQAIKFAVNNFDAFIVLEDDIELKRGALEEAVRALENNFSDNKIMHVNLWNYGFVNARQWYFSRHMHCWGWGSWSNRWTLPLESELNHAAKLRERVLLSKFFSTSHYSHYYGNKLGLKKTWAVLWMMRIVRSDGRCISPPVSLVTNTGFDGGTNTDPVVHQQNDLDIYDSADNAIEPIADFWVELRSWIYNISVTPKLTLFRSWYLVLFK